MRRTIFLSCLLTLLHLYGYAQLEAGPILGPAPQLQALNLSSTTSQARSTSCGPDTVAFVQAKATSLRSLNVNNATSADKVSQWFDAPQPITLHGFTFYAWQSSGNPGSVTLSCKVAVADVDTLPTNINLASKTIQVDTTFGGGVLSVIEKTVIFDNPVSISFPYVLVVETSSATPVSIVTSDWDSTSLDGQQEWLGSASLPGTGWLHGYEVNVGTQLFDADFNFQPHVSYNLNADFDMDVQCVPAGGTVTFSNLTNSPILHSRFYNQYAYVGWDSLIYTWDYGDGTSSNIFEESHLFQSGTNYDVILRANLAGWSVTCDDIATDVVNRVTESEFSYTTNSLMADFTDLTFGANDWQWDFGDGASSFTQNPTHTFPAYGVYNVCLTTDGGCTTNTKCIDVFVCDSMDLPLSDFSYSQSGLDYNFNNLSSGGQTFLWTFGDGDTANVSNPAHTYNDYGTYTVCLTVFDTCLSATECKEVVVCNVLASNFSYSDTGLAIMFVNLGIDTPPAVQSLWDFGDGFLSTQPNPQHTYDSSGTYSVCLILNNGCDIDTACQSITVSDIGTSVNTAENPDEIQLYPNPNSGKFYLRSNGHLEKDVVVYDIYGQQLLQQLIYPGENIPFDLSKYGRGIYYLKVMTESGFISEEILLF